jgi:hypothetical protein
VRKAGEECGRCRNKFHLQCPCLSARQALAECVSIKESTASFGAKVKCREHEARFATRCIILKQPNVDEWSSHDVALRCRLSAKRLAKSRIKPEYNGRPRVGGSSARTDASGPYLLTLGANNWASTVSLTTRLIIVQNANDQFDRGAQKVS